MKPKPGEFAHIEHTVECINAYVREGIPVGDFLYAVLSNDLKGAFNRADSNNYRFMGDIIRYLWNYVPSACWGSPENVRAWIDFKQQQRRMEQLAKRTEPDADVNRMEHDDRGDN